MSESIQGCHGMIWGTRLEGAIWKNKRWRGLPG